MGYVSGKSANQPQVVFVLRDDKITIKHTVDPLLNTKTTHSTFRTDVTAHYTTNKLN